MSTASTARTLDRPRPAMSATNRPRTGATARPWAEHRTLACGDRILLREVTPADEQLLLTLLEHVTGDARWMRFFTGGADIHRAAAAEACAGDGRLGVLALSDDGTQILGHGMCVPAGGDAAELAFEVADGYHRRGIGSLLLAHLVDRARRAGYHELVADVLPSNRDMIDLLRASPVPMSDRLTDGVRHVSIPLGAPPRLGSRKRVETV